MKYNRLEKIVLLDLDVPITTAISIYGSPIESKPLEEFPEAVEHVFSAGPLHEAVVVEWKGRVCLITYWSAHADRNRDLACMLAKYGKEIGWDLVEEGYLCFRKDGKVRLWCSAAPAIGVSTTEFFAAKNQKNLETSP